MGGAEVAQAMQETTQLDRQLNRLHESLNYYNDNVTRLHTIKQKMSGPVPSAPNDGDKISEPNSTLSMLDVLNGKFESLNSAMSDHINDMQELI